MEAINRERWEAAARSARQRLWAADVACYYAQRRFSQTGADKDQQLWQTRQQEAEEAFTALRAAEEALAQSRSKI